jgi:UDP-N-acetylmuramoyl-L-alanyl-D-glutamate--2,6-diaminopimelate ligase
MEQGLTSAAKRKYIKIVDRREAIKAAISFAKPGDIVLIAGKGHEKYQEIKGVKTHFDDKEELQNLFKELAK